MNVHNSYIDSTCWSSAKNLPANKGDLVLILIWEDSTCHGDTKPVPGPAPRAPEVRSPMYHNQRVALLIAIREGQRQWRPSAAINRKIWKRKKATRGTTLVTQWLRLCTPNTGSLGSITGQGARSHMLQLKTQHVRLKEKKSNMRDPWSNGAVLYLDCGVGYTNLHVW